jgi:four helix bundle protein
MGAAGTRRTRCFTDLVVWQRAYQLVIRTYRETEKFPRREIWGLTSQLRRSCVSIAANIAEGFKKRGRPEKARFLNIAQGSAEETRYYLILASDLGFGDTRTLPPILEEVSRMLEAYVRKLLAPPEPPADPNAGF